MTVDEDELAQLRSNADNLSQCLHALLERIENLETKRVCAPQRQESSESKNESLIENSTASNKKKRGKKKTRSHVDDKQQYCQDIKKIEKSDPENSEQVVMSDVINIDPETGLKKRTIVTERVLTTKTFHALTLDGAVPVQGATFRPNASLFPSRAVQVEPAQLKQIELKNFNGQFLVVKVHPDATHDIRPGDFITHINDQEISSLNQFENIQCLSTLKLMIAPIYNATPIFYRVSGDYNSEFDDRRICRWLSIEVKKGDVIQVLSKDDNWLQARKLNDISKVGYLPASLGFEKVSLLCPYGRRVLVLLGAPGVGRRTIKSMLLRSAPQDFATVVPMTSRAPRSSEIEGREYNFTSKEDMQKRIKDGEMIEWGELDNHLYGTSANSVRTVVRAGRVCVLDCAPRALSYLYNGEFMPFVVQIVPPQLDEFIQLENLRQTKRPIEQLTQTCAESEKIALGPHASQIHLTLMNRNTDVTFKRLMDALSDLKNESQWVPESWMC